MTIVLSPQTEGRLREKAERDGQDVSEAADALIAAALDWDAWDRAEAVVGVRRGDQAVAAGRERPLASFLADQRAKHGFPPAWPHAVVEDATDHEGIRDAA